MLVDREAARAAMVQRNVSVPPADALDLFDDAQITDALGPLANANAMLWSRTGASDVKDLWSAARFCIDLWRSRPDLRAQLPAGLAGGPQGGLGTWLRQSGIGELGLDAGCWQHVSAALNADLAARARQNFVTSRMLMSVLPHGLTPAGRRALFRWFAGCGLVEMRLRPEEVWWLLLEAERNPSRELMLAHAFTPAWQQQHPDGLTVFGRDAFANWFSSAYGALGSWVDPSSWPEWEDAADQIRVSYSCREAWRAAHPNALHDERSARALLAWLSSAESGLPIAVSEWCRGVDIEVAGAELARLGVNVIGHFCYPSGLRVSAESMVKAVGKVGVSVSLRDVHTDAKDDPHHVDFRGMECHDITIVHTQPEPFFDTAYQRASLFERTPRTYRVAYWYWEFDSIPDSWIAHARKVDEVWAATEFVAKGLREKLSIPVRTLFPGVKLAPFERRGKKYFGLDEAPFTFLFTFHMMSVMERKNPLGLIRAFKQAFRTEDAVRLVLKTSFGDRHPTQLQELRDAAAGANITVIDQVFSPDEVLSLMDACNAYVSLHRSEGLGLTMAEAMLMGKPVIATNFSGNVDFMDEGNSLLVPYELVKLGKPIPPYEADLEWAEPSIEQAAQLMRRVYEDQDWAREVGARGKASAEANLSLEAAGRRIASRLAEIRAQSDAPQ